jgi:hypothetical protein
MMTTHSIASKMVESEMGGGEMDEWEMVSTGLNSRLE